MQTVFMICAIVGGTALLFQFVLGMFGFLGDFADAVDVGEVSDVGDVGDASPEANKANLDLPEGGQSDNAGFKLAQYFTFQSVVAFLTFFGLGGWAALEGEQSEPVALVIGSAAGVGFMFAVGYAFQSMRKLEQSGTENIHRTVGCRGRVYLRIPGENAGVGKATIVSQGRTLELKARTPGPELKTGTNVKVSRVIDRDTVEVISVTATADVTS